jgi:hypothetical protein
MISLQNSQALLIEQIQMQVDATRFEWLQNVLNELSDSADPNADLGLYSAMARRKLSDELIRSPGKKISADCSVKPVQMRISDAARLAMLMQILPADSSRRREIITAYFKMGDEQEHIALLRGLTLFEPADYLIDIALDCGRSNNLEVLAALMLDNPFPAQFYTQPAFNQMVLKALFLGLSIERIIGLSTSANADLSRMCESYVIEREEAHREVPADIWLALTPCASKIGMEQLQRYLSHPNRDHRYFCCQALLLRQPGDRSVAPLLQQRLTLEKDEQIHALLQHSLSLNQ